MPLLDELNSLAVSLSARFGPGVRVADDVVELLPRNLNEAAEAVKVRATETRAPLRISLEALRDIGVPDLKSSTIVAGAGAKLLDVEEALGRVGLSLGWLSPGTLPLTVGEWLTGPRAGLRVIPGNRLETAALAVDVALEGGGILRSHPSPRSAAGPGIEYAFLGAAGQAGLLVSATLRALPKPEVREWVHASFTAVAPVVSGLRKLLQRDVPLAEVQLERRGGVLEADFLIAGPGFRLARDRAVVENFIEELGEKRRVRAMSNRTLSFEGELSWDALPKAIERQGTLTLCRLSRESIVVVAGMPVAGAVDQSGKGGGLPETLLAALKGRT